MSVLHTVYSSVRHSIVCENSSGTYNETTKRILMTCETTNLYDLLNMITKKQFTLGASNIVK